MTGVHTNTNRAPRPPIRTVSNSPSPSDQGQVTVGNNQTIIGKQQNCHQKNNSQSPLDEMRV